MCADKERTNADAKWRDFEKTGSIDSYLRYRGIYKDAAADTNLPHGFGIQDGETIGNS